MGILNWIKKGDKEVAKNGAITHTIEPNENGFLYTRESKHEIRRNRLWSKTTSQLKEEAEKRG